MGSYRDFDNWRTLFSLGWLPIALNGKRQIFMVLSLRDEKVRFLYVMANSRKEVMEWIVAPENRILREICEKKDNFIKWGLAKEIKRGKIREYFEIVRLLENDLPEKSFFGPLIFYEVTI